MNENKRRTNVRNIIVVCGFALREQIVCSFAYCINSF